jgi:hypothetical protein
VPSNCFGTGLAVQLADCAPHRTEGLCLVLHAGALDQLHSRDLVFRESHTSRQQLPARVLDDQSGMMQRRACRLGPEQGRDERGPAADSKP